MIQIRPTLSGKSKFAQKFETVSRKFNLAYYASWPQLSWYHHAISQTASAKSELRCKEPQKRAELKNNSPQRTQRAQSTGISKIFFEKTRTQRRRTWIRRIFADIFNPRASASSAQSVFHRTPSAFIRVHPRLAELNITPHQRSQSMAAVIFASFALFAVRFINILNELLSIAQPSAFIGVHPRLIYRMAPAEGR